MRDNIILQCPDCKRRNYGTTKNKKKTTERLEMSKYCRFCRKQHRAQEVSHESSLSSSLYHCLFNRSIQ